MFAKEKEMTQACASIQNGSSLQERGGVKSFLISAVILLLAAGVCGTGVGLIFKSTFWICVVVVSPLVLMVLCMWAAHKRLYYGAKAGMAIWLLIKYAITSDEYRDSGPEYDSLGKNALYYDSPLLGPYDPHE